MNRQCSKSCRYFDWHGTGSRKGDCQALGSMPRSIRTSFAIITVPRGHETSAGRPCPYDGPYNENQAYTPPQEPTEEAKNHE